MGSAIRGRLFETTHEERSKPQMEPGSVRKMTTPALSLSLVVAIWLNHSFLNFCFLVYRMGIITHTFYDNVVKLK